MSVMTAIERIATSVQAKAPPDQNFCQLNALSM
jgi:hypothetical protein